MLEHQKLILDKLSYDKEFFHKEIIKSFRWLSSDEISALYDWLKEKYMSTHEDVINDIFQHEAA